MKLIEHTTTIGAPPTTVWEVLTDTAAYPTWNPFITRFGGELAIGGRPSITINPGNRTMTFRPTILDVRPAELIRWRGRMGIAGIFDGVHELRLTPAADGGTVFTQREGFSGILIPMLGRVLADSEVGFTAMNTALAARATTAHGVTGGKR